MMTSFFQNLAMFAKFTVLYLKQLGTLLHRLGKLPLYSLAIIILIVYLYRSSPQKAQPNPLQRLTKNPSPIIKPVRDIHWLAAIAQILGVAIAILALLVALANWYCPDPNHCNFELDEGRLEPPATQSNHSYGTSAPVEHIAEDWVKSVCSRNFSIPFLPPPLRRFVQYGLIWLCELAERQSNRRSK